MFYAVFKEYTNMTLGDKGFWERCFDLGKRTDCYADIFSCFPELYKITAFETSDIVM